MQVRPGHATGRPDLADLVTRFDHGARRDVDVVQVAIQRDEPLSVIDEHGLTVEEVIAGVYYDTGRRREHRRADGCGDVHARMRIARLIIEYAT